MVIAAVVTVSAACSGGGTPSQKVASLHATATTKPSSTTPGPHDLLAYSRCMRDHGIKDFPDPDSQGRLKVTVHPGSDMEPGSAPFKAALQACRALSPEHLSPQLDASHRAAALKYSQCMREHGIKDFPDPNADGGLQIRVTAGSDLDPDSKPFKDADAACRHFMGDRAGGDAGQSLDKQP